MFSIRNRAARYFQCERLTSLHPCVCATFAFDQERALEMLARREEMLAGDDNDKQRKNSRFASNRLHPGILEGLVRFCSTASVGLRGVSHPSIKRKHINIGFAERCWDWILKYEFLFLWFLWHKRRMCLIMTVLLDVTLSQDIGEILMDGDSEGSIDHNCRWHWF